MQKIRVAVIGVGYLGKFHAEKYTLLDNVTLVGVCDTHIQLAQEIAQKHHCKAFTDYTDLIGLVDAVSIVTPTSTHCEIGHFFLAHRVHVLIEKPLTETLEETDKLLALATQHHLILQVGYLERFNPVIKYTEPFIEHLSLIESTRLAPFNPRGADVNVILDLMSHDINLILSFVKSPIKNIQANGAAVVSNHIDFAHARIEFENTCVANISASRVSFKTERKMCLFQKDACVNLDLQQCELYIYKRNNQSNDDTPIYDHKKFPKNDGILQEIENFICAITMDDSPLVNGQDARHTLEVAIKISELCECSQ